MSDALTQEAGKSGEKKALIFDVQRFFMNAPWRRFIGCPTTEWERRSYAG
jgi:hypothetical protein